MKPSRMAYAVGANGEKGRQKENEKGRGRSRLQKLPNAESAAVFLNLYQLPRLQRVSFVQRGIPARWFVSLAGRMAMPKDRLYKTIGVAKATLNRKIRMDQRLDRGESDGVLGMALLLGQVQTMLAESGGPADFDAASWMSSWLERPQRALGGRRPDELMDTADGRTLVSDLLGRMQSGAYS